MAGSSQQRAVRAAGQGRDTRMPVLCAARPPAAHAPRRRAAQLPAHLGGRGEDGHFPRPRLQRVLKALAVPAGRASRARFGARGCRHRSLCKHRAQCECGAPGRPAPSCLAPAPGTARPAAGRCAPARLPHPPAAAPCREHRGAGSRQRGRQSASADSSAGGGCGGAGHTVLHQQDTRQDPLQPGSQAATLATWGTQKRWPQWRADPQRSAGQSAPP